MGWADGLYKGTQSVEDGQVSGRGLGAWFLNPFVDEQKLNEGKQEVLGRQKAEAAGVDYDKLGLDGSENLSTVGGKIVGYKEKKASDASETSFKREMAPLVMAQKESTAARIQQGKRSDNQFTIQMEQLRNDRADAKDQRALDLELRRDELAREDMRYNERIDRESRRDRKQSIQTLVQGLASLGAAFAL